MGQKTNKQKKINMRIVKLWKRFPGEAVHCASLEVFKTRLDNALL